MINVITEKSQWTKELELVNQVDFYHTYDYHYLSKKADESAILIKYQNKNNLILLPLLIRGIKGSDYKDATSVYGYCGVLINDEIPMHQIDEFTEELNTFFISNKIISVFSRLHPFIENQALILGNMGRIINPGKVVYINLNEPIEVQRAKFSRRLKTYLNKSRKSCDVILGNIEEHLEVFIDLYNENMDRVEADDSYYFPSDYYKKLLSSTDFETDMLLCIHNETNAVIGGALFIKKGEIVQYHLSGYNGDYEDLNPIKLILDEMRIKATNEGYKLFNLGGGRGSQEDSLFKFKSTFSKTFKPFNLWKYIVDESSYKALVEQQGGASSTDDLYDADFFPAYRKKIKMIFK
ncbi:MAG: peptidoglycan bridge formation glycyltransferase FemA/FemB family protein [Winogradskyella sp.]|uniref:peptidoglycan bridge formation glycyltransferase FemA/FemB family protein n=1 Tax=Winogradskyella sp. TaxID=1883156 RepID=UPI0017BC0FE5|nr:peptidoglycan bridge formation glycyltransferase FemA/FemB family protein [Winogradskyella sp.]